MKKLCIVLLALCFTGSLFAQEYDFGSDDKNPYGFKFDFGASPNLAGNTALGLSVDAWYLGIMAAGVQFTKNTNGVASYDKKTDVRKVTAIETQITRVKLGGLRISAYEDGPMDFKVLPSVNVQHIFQKTTFNLIERDEDRYQYENSNMQSLQLNTSCDLILRYDNKWFIVGGAFSPWDRHKESGFGFDSFEVSEKEGDLKNEVYKGSTGEYEYNTASKSLYWDAKVEFFWDDLFEGYGLFLGGKYQHLSYVFDAEGTKIKDAEQVDKEKTVEQTKQDITATLGVSLAFVKLGASKALVTSSYTMSRYNKIEDNSKKATDHVIGFGVTFRKF